MFSKATYRQALCVSTVYVIGFLNGMEVAWSGPALKMLMSSESLIPFKKEDVSWLASVSSFGNIFCIIFCGIFLPNPGRKFLSLISAFCLTLSWALNTVASSFGALLFSKFLINVSFGFHDITNCIYISETVSTENRGIFVSTLLVFFTLGVEFEYLVGTLEIYDLLNFAPFMVSVLGLILVFYAIESPYYLLTKGNESQAWKNMSVLNGIENFERIARDYDQLAKMVKEDEQIGAKLCTHQNLKMCFNLFVIYSLVYATGCSLFLSYMTVVLGAYDQVLNLNLIMNIFGLVNIVSVAITPFVVDRIGRVPFLVGGFLVAFVSQVVIALSFYFNSLFDNGLSFMPQIIVVFGACLIADVALCLCPVAHVLRAEMLPSKLKNRGTSVILITKALILGIVQSLFVPLGSLFGMGFNFILYAGFALYGAWFAYYYLRETRGKTLVEIRKDHLTE